MEKTSSAHAPSSSIQAKVFINCRGRDTRETLAKDIHEKLSSMGAQVFVYNEDMDPWYSMRTEVTAAIKNANLHVAIFSPRYTESPRCLSDLSDMLTTGAQIIPIFYDVEASDLPSWISGKGILGDPKLRRRQTPRHLTDWSDAVEKVSKMDGYRVNKDVDWGSVLEDLANRVMAMLRQDHVSITIRASVDSSAQSSWDYIRGLTDTVSAFNWGVIVLTLGKVPAFNWGVIVLTLGEVPAFNWGVIVLTLGSYGLLLSTPVFWLCWSILVPEAVIFYLIRPYWKSIKSATPARTADASEHGRAGAIFLKVGMSLALIALLIYLEDLSQRQNKTLLFVGLSIILLEGFPAIFLANEEFKSLRQNPSMIWRNAVNFLSPSVKNAMMIVTGGIVLGGNLGSLMREKPYWIFVSIVVVDLIAESIHRNDCVNVPNSISEEKLSRHYITIVLRLIVEASLCYWMTIEISQKSYFAPQMDAKDCDRKCQERSKSLLITMVVLGGLQAAGTFTPTLCSCVLGLRKSRDRP